jgi:hypothetical protein
MLTRSRLVAIIQLSLSQLSGEVLQKMMLDAMGSDPLLN